MARPKLLPRPWPARWLRHARTREAGRKGDCRPESHPPSRASPALAHLCLSHQCLVLTGSLELRVASHMLSSHGQSHGWGDGEGRRRRVGSFSRLSSIPHPKSPGRNFVGLEPRTLMTIRLVRRRSRKKQGPSRGSPDVGTGAGAGTPGVPFQITGEAARARGRSYH